MQICMSHAAKQKVSTPKLLPGVKHFSLLTYCVAIHCDSVEFTVNLHQYAFVHTRRSPEFQLKHMSVCRLHKWLEFRYFAQGSG